MQTGPPSAATRTSRTAALLDEPRGSASNVGQSGNPGAPRPMFRLPPHALLNLLTKHRSTPNASLTAGATLHGTASLGCSDLMQCVKSVAPLPFEPPHADLCAQVLDVGKGAEIEPGPHRDGVPPPIREAA